jgi:hypothetical protein
MLADLPLIREWLESWKLLSRNALSVLASGLVDVVFLFLIGLPFIFDLLGFVVHNFRILSLPQPGFLPSLFFTGLVLQNLYVTLNQQIAALAGRERPAVIDLLFQQPTSAFTWKFLLLFVAMVAVVWMFFALLRGTSWWIAASIAGRKHRMRSYLKRFAGVSAAWFLVLFLWQVIDSVLDIRNIALKAATGQEAGGGIIMTLLLAGIVYFAAISFVTLNVRSAFIAGTKNAARVLPAFFFVIIHFLAGNLVVGKLAAVSAVLSFIIGALLLLVLLVWSRVYLTLVLGKVWNV